LPVVTYSNSIATKFMEVMFITIKTLKMHCTNGMRWARNVVCMGEGKDVKVFW
jgi:3-methyladenine DNA glycosylase Mpg